MPIKNTKRHLIYKHKRDCLSLKYFKNDIHLRLNEIILVFRCAPSRRIEFS